MPVVVFFVTLLLDVRAHIPNRPSFGPEQANTSFGRPVMRAIAAFLVTIDCCRPCSGWQYALQQECSDAHSKTSLHSAAVLPAFAGGACRGAGGYQHRRDTGVEPRNTRRIQGRRRVSQSLRIEDRPRTSCCRRQPR